MGKGLIGGYDFRMKIGSYQTEINKETYVDIYYDVHFRIKKHRSMGFFEQAWDWVEKRIVQE